MNCTWFRTKINKNNKNLQYCNFILVNVDLYGLVFHVHECNSLLFVGSDATRLEEAARRLAQVDDPACRTAVYRYLA
jgi:hypothetical protein